MPGAASCLKIVTASCVLATLLADMARPLHAQGGDWRVAPAVEARHLAAFSDASLDESSGIVVSRRHPGILWTIEDSGAEAVLHATDTTGADRGSWRVTGATNRDWEALALGRCPAGFCLYIGDIGDNSSARTHAEIYRVPEPDPAGRARATARARRLTVTYPDGPRNAESLAILPDTTLLIISKSESGSRIYEVPASAWRSTAPIRATDRGGLPVPGGSLANLVTDAAVSPDGARLAVRTYTAIYFFRIGPRHQLTADYAGGACGIFGIEPQGEGVAWLDQRHLVTSSENNFGMLGGLGLVRCAGM
jgi:hypothetical protein